MDPRSDKILARFIARGRLLWVPAEDMRRAILAYIPLLLQSIEKGAAPTPLALFLVDPEAGGFAMAPQLSPIEAGIFSANNILLPGAISEDMAWNHIIVGMSVCIRHWVGEKHLRDIHNKTVPAHERMVLDIDALHRAWEGLRPERRWKETKGQRPAAEAMASRLSQVVRSLPVVPLAYNQWMDKPDIRETARWLTVRYTDGSRRKAKAPSMLLGPSFCPMEIE
ncbi:hypothetical protein ACRE_047540 [Hapsidospora chrysogenum ATCC 11550]|uniref:Uncharacterized protein n=1 Tax=Hapsidospora chrysogenum (strain ATCC 11550 / CBS 779.69 / DSM 880 / IAM 14645 / JCM 23072 / IMI 49137) TaxID=857340 RepID=A0A086T512_HAPC1|nr:hypothetical protein ACRE_047540 [Hapsidospora chrysogenum ATCC 11550]